MKKKDNETKTEAKPAPPQERRAPARPAPDEPTPKPSGRTKQLVDHLRAARPEQRPRILAQYQANGISESEIKACRESLTT